MNPIQSSLPFSSSLPTGFDTGSPVEFKSKLESLKQNAANVQTEKMASDFESVFVSLMLKEMRNTLDGENGLFGGEGSDTFGGMFDLFMGQHLSESSPLGIADAIRGFLENRPQEDIQDPETQDPESLPVDKAE
jgi:flagellar protein FlgJ